MSPEARTWVRHYGSGQFTPAFLQARLAELEQPLSEHHKDFEHQLALREALRHLLSKPGLQTTLF